MRGLLVAMLTVPLLGGTALAQTVDSCPNGSYSAVRTDNGSALSVLFDRFVVEGTAGASEVSAGRCRLRVPLDLPPNTSLGVYRVDYRGFSALARRQSATLTVVHMLGPNKTKTFRRRIGSRNGEFAFSETLGAGLMKRIGCGSQATLDVAMILEIGAKGQPFDATAGMDSMDSQGEVTYHFDHKPCPSVKKE